MTLSSVPAMNIFLARNSEMENYRLDVAKHFYDGERIDKKTLKKFLLDATIANLVGKETVKCAIELGLVNPECILKIKGVPHAQIVHMF